MHPLYEISAIMYRIFFVPFAMNVGCSLLAECELIGGKQTWPLKQLGTGLKSTRVVDQSVKGEYKREKIIINYYEKFEHVQS